MPDKGIREKAPGVFEVRVHVGRDPATGHIGQLSRTTRKGVADARRIRARLITEVARGQARRGRWHFRVAAR